MPRTGWAGLTVARILRPRGRKGEVAAQILTDFTERLTTLGEAWLWDAAHPARPPSRIAIRHCWLHKGQAIFHFEGLDSIGDAERLVGLEVQIPLDHRMPLPAGRYYVSDLIGCEVWERGGGTVRNECRGIPLLRDCALTKLGVVFDVQSVGEEAPGVPLLLVETPQGEILIPLAEEICACIDIAARRIEFVLPDGLKEINARE